MSALGTAEIALIAKADLHKAVIAPVRQDAAGSPPEPCLAACAALIHAAAQARVKRLATARISDLDAAEHTLSGETGANWRRAHRRRQRR